MSESYKVYASQEYVDNKFNDVSDLPEGAKPNQYLVTDGEGNAKWEDKLCWSETAVGELLAETTVTIEVDDGWTALNMGKLVVGRKYTVTFDGAVYDAECYYNPAGLPSIGGAPDNWSSYPFVVYNGNDGNSYCIVEKAGTHTISISGEVDRIVKLSGKYVEGMGWSEPTPPLFDAKGVPFDIDSAWGSYFVVIPVNKQLIVGKTYTVVLDGVTYENLVAVDNDPGASIGGSPSGSLSEDVPFSVFNYSGAMQVNVRTGNTHDITIILEEETIHPIDKKYMPASGICLNFNPDNSYVGPYYPAEVLQKIRDDVTIPVVFAMFDNNYMYYYKPISYLDNGNYIVANFINTKGNTQAMYIGSDNIMLHTV